MANEEANYTGSGCNMNDHTLSKAKGITPKLSWSCENALADTIYKNILAIIV